MRWTPNQATLRLQAIKSGKNAKEKNGAHSSEKLTAGTNAKSSGKQAPSTGTGVKVSGPLAKSSTPKKGGTRMKQASKKRAKQMRQYRKLRKVFLEEHEVCEIPVEGCTGVATEVHHTKGRENELLLDVQFFKAACHNCHRVATDKSKEAIADGRSKSRHKKQ